MKKIISLFIILSIISSQAVFSQNTVDDSITRAEATGIIIKMIDLKEDSTIITPFADISKDDKYYGAIATLYKNNIIKGKSDGTFAPNDNITREEITVIVKRASDYLKAELPVEASVNAKDFNLVSDWARDAYTALNSFLIKDEDNLNPGKNATRLEVESMVSSYIKHTTYKKSFSDKLASYMNDNENYCISPLSVKLALSLAASGAEGETKEEILKAVGVNSLSELDFIYKDIIKRYSQAENLKLKISNSVWLNKDNTSQNFSREYEKSVKENYDAEIRVTDNKNAVDEINGWVNEKTNGKISKIISSPDFLQALINAIYFKGLWQSEFMEFATKKGEFTNYDKTVSQADFMNKTAWLPYIKDDGFEAVELKFKNRFESFDEKGDYKGSESFDDLDVSMLFIKADGKIDIERKLNSLLNTDAYERKYISLSLPKFKIEYTKGLNDILKDMGIKKAFDEKMAEFSPMVDKGSTWISGTIHKTYISIDEKGCEAAAVTALLMGNSALPPEPYKLSFDTPFKFVIRDNKTGEILFSGGLNTLENK